MADTILVEERNSNFFEMFDVITRLEQSEKPDIEKLPILIKCARDYYGKLDFKLEKDKVLGWEFDEETQRWRQSRMLVSECVEQATKAYDKREDEKALQNMGEAYLYFKERYGKMVNIWRPFYEYNFKLLTLVEERTPYLTAAQDKLKESKDLKNSVKSLDSQVSALKKELQERNQTIEKAKGDMDTQIKTFKSFSLWVKLIADKRYLETEIEARVVAYLLQNAECDSPSMALKMRLDTPKTQTTCNSMEKRGILKARQIGRVNFFSLNHVFAEKPVMEGETEQDAKTESLFDKIVAHKRKKAVEEQERIEKIQKMSAPQEDEPEPKKEEPLDELSDRKMFLRTFKQKLDVKNAENESDDVDTPEKD